MPKTTTTAPTATPTTDLRAQVESVLHDLSEAKRKMREYVARHKPLTNDRSRGAAVRHAEKKAFIQTCAELRREVLVAGERWVQLAKDPAAREIGERILAEQGAGVAP
jgi:predicted AAA+ superfamily ATPase